MRMSSWQSTRPCNSMVSVRVVRHERQVALPPSSLTLLVQKRRQPGFTEPTLPRKRIGQVSALLRPQPLPDSTALPTATLAAAIRSSDRRCGSHFRGALLLVPTVANNRDRHRSVCAQGGREASPGQSAIAHESSLVGKTPAAIWRYAPHVAPDKTMAITVSTPSFLSLRRLRS
jgi:hypothetical protein